MRHHIHQVLSLVWSSRFDHAFFGFDKHFFAVSKARLMVLLKHAGFFYGKMNLLGFNIGNLTTQWSRFNVKCFDDVECRGGSMRLTHDGEEVAAVVDFDSQATFKMLDVVIKRTAQAGESVVIGRFQIDF